MMARKCSNRGYFIVASRELAYPPSWHWRIVRRGKPMGVRIEGGGFPRGLAPDTIERNQKR